MYKSSKKPMKMIRQLYTNNQYNFCLQMFASMQTRRYENAFRITGLQ